MRRARVQVMQSEFILLAFALFGLGLASCSSSIDTMLVVETEAIYLPPAAATTPTPLFLPTLLPTSGSLPETTKLISSPTPECTSNLIFVEDLSIPDGSLVPPNARLDKRWQVENNGSCNWDDQYQIKLIAGPELGAASSQSLFPARSGTSAIIRILFTAPAEAGTYRSAWQAYNPQEEPFGDPFFIEIQVDTTPESE